MLKVKTKPYKTSILQYLLNIILYQPIYLFICLFFFIIIFFNQWQPYIVYTKKKILDFRLPEQNTWC